MRSVALAAAVSLACAGAGLSCRAQPTTFPPPTVLDQIHPDALKAHMAFLADDLLEGRGTGTRGYLLAARYVAAQFAEMGLEPAGDRGTFFQTVVYRQVEVNAAETTATVRPSDGAPHALALDREYAVFGDALRTTADADAPVVFAGYGVTAPEFSYDDYAGADVKGKLVLVLYGAPPRFGAAPRAHYSNNEEKLRTAAAHGAVGVLGLWSGSIAKQVPFPQIIRFSHQLQMRWLDANGAPNATMAALRLNGGVVLNEDTAAVLFAGSGHTVADAVAAAEAGDSRPIALHASMAIHLAASHRAMEAPNVAAVLRGNDATARNEYIVLTAHIDHEGIGEPQDGDRIYNGAMDNASGTAALIEIARALRVRPPRRSILFLAVGGEEAGLLGSDYYARHPTVDAAAIAANVNIDGISLLYDFRDIVALGSEHSNIGAAVADVAQRLGLEVSEDPQPEQVFFIRSDQYSFVKQGVPAVMLGEGFKAADPAIDGRKLSDAWTATRYHTPKDDMNQPLDFAAAVKCTRVDLAVVYELAQRRERPAWNRGDFFERFGREGH